MPIESIDSNNNYTVNTNSNIKSTSNSDSNKASAFNDKLNEIISKDDNPSIAKILNEINNETDPVDREEDMILFNDVKHMIRKASGNVNLKMIKEGTITFPSATAPGYVRKAYRKALEKLPESQRGHITLGLALEYNTFIDSAKNGNAKVNSSLSVYENFMNYIEKAINSNPDFLGSGSSQHIRILFNNFQSNLQMY
ncbi:hypothetical protein CPAST_c32530 [Clostridium pasteurianum DSM 525 = ATCC 6013]|uniref:Uncharacterized protein n=1 Tax=Clostridium pasteurianum DSM 525 = ATCC 6013 TaxID=1262449 RepID=A0A0H3J769_CLOPA|nr:hypothetical protein [Clostridium pasteurianum]AJA49319.1 hypothetical protein CPAST_c32530 [Clostridium pasteurianum DSM 525 = ATCC 6013]AJA53307.1 hypothetical protein CLPA_c32530 [Clostridium pasteurianum DSM 525 = ATCC 6013]AOZ76496.1 hypothetical protein AQ983_15800 [Clostridium pasteurianum DSM 525 = ATCC 6013]AOZ80293.1 hypothetical protein AQ984_15795 [Clostridium pasteurianum]ELP58340.1 hypothetical protein F502_15275 [Clostridium pasteurianum DSM 525 = ATCC 6013]